MAPVHNRTRLEMAICGVCTAIISHSTTCLESARQCMAPVHNRTRLEMAIFGVCTAIISHRRPIIVAEVSHADPCFTDHSIFEIVPVVILAVRVCKTQREAPVLRVTMRVPLAEVEPARVAMKFV